MKNESIINILLFNMGINDLAQRNVFYKQIVHYFWLCANIINCCELDLDMA